MELAGSGTSCTTVQPGFVDSQIRRVDNKGAFRADRRDPAPAKLMWPAPKAARVVVDAIWRREREFTFTGHGRAIAFLGRHTPGLVHFAATRFGPKG